MLSKQVPEPMRQIAGLLQIDSLQRSDVHNANQRSLPELALSEMNHHIRSAADRYGAGMRPPAVASASGTEFAPEGLFDIVQLRPGFLSLRNQTRLAKRVHQILRIHGKLVHAHACGACKNLHPEPPLPGESGAALPVPWLRRGRNPRAFRQSGFPCREYPYRWEVL